MKIGIMSFEESLNTRTLRGIFTTTKYLQKNLTNVGLEVDLLVYGRGKLDYPVDYNIVHKYSSPEELRFLRNEYDFMIYFTPGRSIEKYDEKDPDRYIDVLDSVGLPFTFIYHSEEYKSQQPYRKNFILHRDCKFLVFIVDGFKDIYKEDLELKSDYIVASMVPPLNSLEYIKGFKKSESVIITSAWTNFKRNLDYFQIVGKFLEYGITPYSAGSPSSNFYMNDILDLLVSRVELLYDGDESDSRSIAKYRDYTAMMARIKQEIPYKRNEESKMSRVVGANIYDKSGRCWNDYGAYYPEELPRLLGDKKFHWNMSCYKVNKPYISRFEIVTLEAFNEGCLPIICKETTPEWVPDDSAIRLSKKDYESHIGDLAEISDTERISRLEKFYSTVKDNLYDKMFHDFKSHIENSIL